MALRDLVGGFDHKDECWAVQNGYASVKAIAGRSDPCHIKAKLDRLVAEGKAETVTVKSGRVIAAWYKAK